MLFRLVAAGFIAVTFTASPASADAATLVEKLGGKYKRTVSFAGQLLLKCDASNVSLPLVAALKEDYDFGCGQHATSHLDLHVVSTAERAHVENLIGKPCHVADPDMEASLREFEESLEDFSDAETAPSGPRSRRQSGSPSGWLTRYNSFEDQMSWYAARAGEHAIATWVENISPTGRRTPGGRAISAVRITGPGDAANRRRVWIQCGLHAREWVSPAFCAHLTNHVLTNYQSDSQLRSLLAMTELIVIPNANPDGYVYTWTDDRMWRKNRQRNSGSTCVGTDLNRNYNDRWSSLVGVSTDPCSNTYRGSAANSAPEIDITTSYFKSLRPIHGAIDFHSYGEIMLRPFGWSSAVCAPHEHQHATLATEMQTAIRNVHGTQYRSDKSAGLYPTTSTADDWFYGNDANADNGGYHAWTFIIELPSATGYPGFLLPTSQIESSCEEMVPAVLLFMNRAATAPLSYIEYQPGGAGLSEPVETGTIECGAQYSGTTATLCGSAVGDPSPEVSYSFTVPSGSSSGSWVFSTCRSDFDTRLRLFNSDYSSRIADADDEGNCGTQAVLTVPAADLTAGIEYHIVLEGFGSSTGNYELVMNCPTYTGGATNPPTSPPTNPPTRTSRPTASPMHTEPTTFPTAFPTTSAPTVLVVPTTLPTAPTDHIATTLAPGTCPRNCGQTSRGGGTCRPNGNCLSCNSDRIRVNGRCAQSLSCRGRRIQSGSMTGNGCGCLDNHCHYCTRIAAGDTCRVCRDGYYLLDAACVEACPSQFASSGVGLFKRRCAAPFICQSGRLVGVDVNYGCKCAAEANTAIADCQICEHRAGEYGQHCTKCNNGKFLVRNRCTRDSCDGLDGLVPYAPSQYGRECRAPFTCTDRVDENGDSCKCSREVGRSDCSVCSYSSDGASCQRCTNSRYLRNGVCVFQCPVGEYYTGSGPDGRECH